MFVFPKYFPCVKKAPLHHAIVFFSKKVMNVHCTIVIYCWFLLIYILLSANVDIVKYENHNVSLFFMYSYCLVSTIIKGKTNPKIQWRT